MMRVVGAALAALVVSPLVLAAAPAAAQVTYAPETYGPGAVTIVGPATVVMPDGPRTLTVRRRVLVPHTHYERRTVLVPRTRYVRRTREVPVTTYSERTNVATLRLGPYGTPAGFAPVYPGTGLVGPTWVPPGTSYACQLGTVGCDSSVVGAMAF